MQRRMIYASLFGDIKVAELSVEARYTYIGLVVLADDDGRLEADPVLLKSRLYPRDSKISWEDVAKWCNEIVDKQLVEPYTESEQPYFFHPKWSKYQKLRQDRKKPSLVPAPDNQMTTNCQPDDGHFAAQDKVSKGKLSKGKVILPEWLDEKTWNMWVEFRKEIKHPLKDTTMQLQIKKLEKYKSIHKEVLLQSMENGWQGIFPENYRPPKNHAGIKPVENKYKGL